MHAKDETLRDAVLRALPSGVRRVGVAVSGGSDSVALLRLLARAPTDISPLSDIVILHVDHGLRRESALDAKFVADLATAHGVPSHILSWQGEKPKSGLQEAARGARYALMIEKCRSLELDALITGHTLDDQAETFFMRLKRGSGLDGLASMSLVSSLDGFTVMRPLLKTRRQDLQNYLTEIGQSWRDDPSNDNTDFERVQVRQSLPGLEGAGLGAERLAQSAERLWRAKQAIDAYVDSAMPEAVRWYEAGYAQLDQAVFNSLPDEIALRVLSHVLQGVGGAPRAPQLQKLESAYADLKHCEAGAGITLAGCRLVVKSDALYVVREKERTANAAVSTDMILATGEKRVWDRRFMCEVYSSADTPLNVRALGPAGWAHIKGVQCLERDMPSYVAHQLVSLWRGDELLSVPHIGFDTAEVEFNARFIPHGMRVLPELRSI